jgi:uncharacterized repeat protein (TIGR03803 family)
MVRFWDCLHRRRGSCLGGGTGCGTVFSLDPETGAETVLYTFAGGTDGYYPGANLLDVNGVLYGTTAAWKAAATT